MIVIDTHIWIWWVNQSPDLTAEHQQLLATHKADGIGVSAISCWEVAKLVEKERITLVSPIRQWLDSALAQEGVTLLPLTPDIAADSTQLPGSFHSDPADQIIVATARVRDCPLLTVDTKIVAYPHVKLLPSAGPLPLSGTTVPNP